MALEEAEDEWDREGERVALGEAEEERVTEGEGVGVLDTVEEVLAEGQEVATAALLAAMLTLRVMVPLLEREGEELTERE